MYAVLFKLRDEDDMRSLNEFQHSLEDIFYTNIIELNSSFRW